jgi:hypothetical protein
MQLKYNPGFDMPRPMLGPLKYVPVIWKQSMVCEMCLLVFQDFEGVQRHPFPLYLFRSLLLKPTPYLPPNWTLNTLL